MVDIYKLYRNYWDFAFENPEKITPNHIALYSFIIEHCNRLGWKNKFGLPTTMAMEAIGIKSYNTYSKILNDLINYGFIEMVQKSKNQYSSNIIGLSFALSKNDKALDKALIKHGTKQSESTVQSIDSIIIQIYNIQINQFTKEQIEKIVNYFNDTKKIEIKQNNIANISDLEKEKESEKKINENNEKVIINFINHLGYTDQTKEMVSDWFVHLMRNGKDIKSHQVETFLKTNEQIYGNNYFLFKADIYYSIERGYFGLFRKNLKEAGFDEHTGKKIPQYDGDYTAIDIFGGAK